MAIRFVLFDFDGVLLDTEPLHDKTRQKLARELFGGSCDMDINTIIGGSAIETYTRVLAHFGREGDPAALAHLHYATLADDITQHCAVPSDDLLRLLDGLDARGIGYGVCSSSPRFYVDQILAAMGIAQRFRFVCGGDEVAQLKPAPDLYCMGIEQSGIPAEQIAAVEDSRTGIAAAKAAGLFCYGYRYAGNGQDLSRADRIIEDLCAILSDA